jgi:hypothetical protein
MLINPLTKKSHQNLQKMFVMETPLCKLYNVSMYILEHIVKPAVRK